MKKTLISLCLLCGLTAFGQTNNLSFTQLLQAAGQDIANSTNWTAIGGGGITANGKNQLVFADLSYNFTANVGLVAGVDRVWASGGSQANLVKGGVTLSLPMHPLAFIGSTFLTNVVATPFVGDLLAQPKGGNAIGNLTVEGVNFDVYAVKNFEVVAGVEYEQRAGQAQYDGNYWLLHVGLSRRF